VRCGSRPLCSTHNGGYFYLLVVVIMAALRPFVKVEAFVLPMVLRQHLQPTHIQCLAKVAASLVVCSSTLQQLSVCEVLNSSQHSHLTHSFLASETHLH
jgi:hypothetical protein